MELNPAILEKNTFEADGRLLPLMEAFYTIQGEGYHQGKAAYFIRLGGCDVGCVWCDVKESWDASLFSLHPVEDLANVGFAARIAVVTGGEPLLHPLGPLCHALHEKGFHTHLETSGTRPLSGNWDWVCLSPKKFKAPLPEVCLHAQELKVVIFHPSDLSWAEQHAAKVSPACRLFLQPEWDRREKVTPLIIDYIKKHPRWEISLQMHKYLGVP